MRTAFAIVVLLALAGPVWAGQIPEQQWAAVTAADTHAKYCAEGVDQTISASGSAIAEVGTMWASLDGMPERTGATGLLYWRGLLAECLGRQEHAIADLSRFLELHKNDTTWVEPVRDAIRRLQRMGIEMEPEAAGPPTARIVGVSVGGLMGAGAGVMGALAGVRGGHRDDMEALFYSGTLRTADFNGVDAAGLEATQDANGFAAGAIGLGAGAITAVLVSALAPRASRGTLHRVAVLGVATPQGTWLGLGGRW